MATDQENVAIRDEVRRWLGDRAAASRLGADGEAALNVELDAVTDVVRQLRIEGASLIDLTVVPRQGALHLLATLTLRRGLLTVETALPAEAPSYQSLTPVQPSVHWLERELADLWGVRVVGHPQPERLLFPSGRVPANPPLRPAASTSPRERPPAPRLEAEGVFYIPFGPVRSGVVEAAETRVETSGEDMLRVEPQPFYKHRGMEKRFVETPLALTPLLAERIAGVMSCSYTLAYCQAVERAAGVELGERARLLRTLLAELERCFNHIDVVMKLCDDASLSVAVAQFAIIKERLLRLNLAITGNRYLRGAIVLGGVKIDIDRNLVAVVEREIDAIERLFETNVAILLRTESFIDRLIGTGRLAQRDADAFAACGPVARGSGLANDARVERPYAAYAAVTVEPTVHGDGDAMARLEVRLSEVRNAFLIVRQAMELLRPGPLVVELPAIAPGAAAHGWAEAPEGEVLVYVEFDDEGRLGRCHIRSAALMNWGVFHRTTARNVLTDYAFIEHSFGLSQASCDR